MKVLLANTTAFPVIGGVENSLRFIGRELLRQGHQPRIFCFQTDPSQPLESEHEGIPITRVPYEPRRWPHARLREAVETTRRAVPAILERFQPDVVWSRSVAVGAGIRRGGFQGPLLQIFSTNARMHCQGIYLSTRGLPWRRRLMLLGLWPSEYFAAARLEQELARKCIAVAFSENMRGQLLADFPTDVRTCQVIRPGVDRDVFSPENGARFFAQIERDYGIRPGEPIVLYVGRLSTAKHLPMLMDAMALLKTPARLVMVGGGSDEARLRAYGQQLGLGDRLIFAGPHHEMLPGFYAAARVFVLPTTTESFGQVYLEAMACGTPAVGFAGDGKHVLTATGEIITDGENGVVVREPRCASLAEGMESVLSCSEPVYQQMAARARAAVEERFSWARFTEAALALSGGDSAGGVLQEPGQ